MYTCEYRSSVLADAPKLKDWEGEHALDEADEGGVED